VVRAFHALTFLPALRKGQFRSAPGSQLARLKRLHLQANLAPARKPLYVDHPTRTSLRLPNLLLLSFRLFLLDPFFPPSRNVDRIIRPPVSLNLPSLIVSLFWPGHPFEVVQSCFCWFPWREIPIPSPLVLSSYLLSRLHLKFWPSFYGCLVPPRSEAKTLHHPPPFVIRLNAVAEVYCSPRNFFTFLSLIKGVALLSCNFRVFRCDFCSTELRLFTPRNPLTDQDSRNGIPHG